MTFRNVTKTNNFELNSKVPHNIWLWKKIVNDSMWKCFSYLLLIWTVILTTLAIRYITPTKIMFQQIVYFVSPLAERFNIEHKESWQLKYSSKNGCVLIGFAVPLSPMCHPPPNSGQKPALCFSLIQLSITISLCSPPSLIFSLSLTLSLSLPPSDAFPWHTQIQHCQRHTQLSITFNPVLRQNKSLWCSLWFNTGMFMTNAFYLANRV